MENTKTTIATATDLKGITFHRWARKNGADYLKSTTCEVRDVTINDGSYGVANWEVSGEVFVGRGWKIFFSYADGALLKLFKTNRYERIERPAFNLEG